MAVTPSDYVIIGQVQEASLTGESQQWLIDSIWIKEAVGIICGAPKSCKSWLCLDMAVAIASGTDALGKFRTLRQGPVLIYLAEDNLFDVKKRIHHLCQARSIDIKGLPVYSLTAPRLRLDDGEDQRSLATIIESVKPVFMVLDPLVRLHSLDENNASEMAKLLSYLRALQRHYSCAIALVHHATKRAHSRPGLNLRGSSDLHAFGDSNIYLSREEKNIKVSIEHRSAASPEDFEMALRDDPCCHLKVTSASVTSSATIEELIVAILKQSNIPQTRTALREKLRLNNQRLGCVLSSMEQKRIICRDKDGWHLA